jgi:hypothetical protein
MNTTQEQLEVMASRACDELARQGFEIDNTGDCESVFVFAVPDKPLNVNDLIKAILKEDQ